MPIISFNKVLAFILCLTAFVSCENSKNLNAKNQAMNLQTIKLQKVTRGNSSLLQITPSEITKTQGVLGGQGEAVATKTKAENWQKIGELISKINLNEMANWEAPTQERFHDGARITTLEIQANGEVYSSQAFDEGQPPVQLKELYDYLESL